MGVVAPRVIAKLCIAVPTVAFSVAVCAVLTAATVALKLALVAPAATVTEEGTATADVLLDKATAWPPVGAAAFSVTVQVSVVAFVSEAPAQLRLLGIACPVPVRVTVEVVPVEELLVRVSFPLAGPAVVGLKAIARVADCPAASVNCPAASVDGRLSPERVKPAPLRDPALIVTVPVPDEVSVTD